MGVGSGCVVWVFFHGTNVPIPPKLVSLPQAKWRCCSLVWTRHSYTWMMSLGNQDRRCFSTALQTYTTNRLSWYFGNSSSWGAHPEASNLAAVIWGSAWIYQCSKIYSGVDFTHWSYACSWGKTVYLKLLVFYYWVLLPDGLQEGLWPRSKITYLLLGWSYSVSFVWWWMAFFSEELSLCVSLQFPLSIGYFSWS